MPSTTPARTLGLSGLGVIVPGALADFVVLDRHFRVVETWIGGVAGPLEPPGGTPVPPYSSFAS